MKTNFSKTLGQLVAACAALVVHAVTQSALSAATLSVTSTSDSGPGTLRAALASAMNGDTIAFSLTLPAIITVTSGELVVSNNVTIAGPGAPDLSLSGNNANRVFNVASNRTVNISGLTIRDGSVGEGMKGGGIYNEGTLTLSNCVVSFNRAGSGSFFDTQGGHGGGVFNAGSLTLVGCTFSSNRAGFGRYGYGPPGGHGGGVFNAGSLTVRGCTFNSNRAGDGGVGGSASDFGVSPTSGGLGGRGGGIFNGRLLLVVSSTFHDNRAGIGGTGGSTSFGGSAASGGPGGSGGGIYSSGQLGVTSCTFSGNQSGPGGAGGYASPTGRGGDGGTGGEGGGVFQVGVAGSAAMRNSIFALNAGGPGGPGGIGSGGFVGFGAPGSNPDVRGSFVSQGRNLVGVGGSTGLTNGMNGDIVGNTNNPVHPLLGALQDNGGPTWTMSLLTGSPAMDAGDDALTGTDQRGFPRLSGARVDIGAVEGVSELFSRGEALLVNEGQNNSVVAMEVRSGAAAGTLVQASGGANYRILGPRGMLCVSNQLLVVNQNVGTPYSGEVLVFDLNTGAFIEKRVPGTNPDAPYLPRGMILGTNSMLLVADLGGFDGIHPPRIVRYSHVGTFLGNVNTSGLSAPFFPIGLIIGPDNLLYVAGTGDLSQGSKDGYIFRFQFNPATQNYHYLNTIVASTAANYYASGLHSPEGIVFGPDGNIYITSFYASFNNSQGATVEDRDAILVFNSNGQRVGSPIHLWAAGESRVFGQSLLFGPRGDLFVPITSGSTVRRYSASSGFQQFTVLPTGGASPQEPWYLTFRATNPRTLAYEPPRVTGRFSGDDFNVSWPFTYVGWQLQTQTNVAVGLTSNWQSVPESLLTNSITVTRTNPFAAFRLLAP